MGFGTRAHGGVVHAFEPDESTGDLKIAGARAWRGPPVAFVGWTSYTHNFHAIRPGQLYRSARCPPDQAADTIRQYRIKTVLNLRGPNANQAWYRSERDAALKEGATLVDVSMSSCEWMSRAQLRAVVTLLETGERPILIHCQHGSQARRADLGGLGAAPPRGPRSTTPARSSRWPTSTSTTATAR